MKFVKFGGGGGPNFRVKFFFIINFLKNFYKSTKPLILHI
jgi:hypothetical protein